MHDHTCMTTHACLNAAQFRSVHGVCWRERERDRQRVRERERRVRERRERRERERKKRERVCVCAVCRHAATCAPWRLCRAVWWCHVTSHRLNQRSQQQDIDAVASERYAAASCTCVRTSAVIHVCAHICSHTCVYVCISRKSL